MDWRPRLRLWNMRGALAALFSSLSIAPGFAFAAAETPQAPAATAEVLGQTQLNDGLTLVERRANISPSAALEIWIRCPASGYGASRPGIARLAVLALLEKKSGDTTLRELFRRAGAQVGVSVYHEGTEIAVLAPSYQASAMLETLAGQVLHPRVDQSAYLAARQRLAAQQVATTQVPDQLLRDSLFSHMFASGPLHDPTYGDAQTLANLSLDDVNAFLGRAYVPANEIVIAAGNVDSNDISRRVSSQAPPPANAEPMPDSALSPIGVTPTTLQRSQASMGGVGIGWFGPPIADEQASTAMDFLSDYLTRPGTGLVAQAVAGLYPTVNFYGQFITLRNPGVFFISATGATLDPDAALGTIRESVRKAVAAQLSKPEFGRALDAFRTHLLRELQTPQQVADNYGWYFTQGATGYSPSATDARLGGDYFAQVQRLTPAYVSAIAKRYLSTEPAVIVLPRGPLPTAVNAAP